MEKILYAELNIVCIVVCLLMLHNLTRRCVGGGSLEQRIFVMLIAADILILLADGGNWVLSGVTSEAAFAWNVLCFTVYYILNPVICLLWLIYADFQLFRNWGALKKRLGLYVIPAAVSGLMAVASPVTGWFFVLDEQNQYLRGSLFWVMVAASLVYLVVPAILTLQNLLRYGVMHSSTVYAHLLLFPVILGGAVIVQVLYFGVSVIWAATTLAILSAFISMQNTDIVQDYLTGLANRRRLDSVLQVKIKSSKPENVLFLIMSDVDNFKKINDRLGHVTGDEALKQVAGILRENTLIQEDFVARYGGDEFVILGSRGSRSEVDALMQKLTEACSRFNEREGAPYLLSLSMGAAFYDGSMSSTDFLAAADREMYRKKELH